MTNDTTEARCDRCKMLIDPTCEIYRNEKGGVEHDYSDECIAAQRAEIERLTAELERVKKSALMGMDAAKASSGVQLREAARLHAESAPDALASERSANEVLTKENEELRAQLESAKVDAGRLDWLAAHPRQADITVQGPRGMEKKPAIFWGVSAHPNWSLREAVDAAMKEQNDGQ